MAVRIRKQDPAAELHELLEASGRNAERAAVLMRDLLEDFPERAHLAADVLACEQTGDALAHDILHLIAEQPEDRGIESGDVHSLTSALDDIVDYAEEAADRLVLYRVEAPMEQAQELATVLVGAATEVHCALRSLSAGRDLGPHLVEIHRLENEGDRIVRAATASLFVAGIDPMIVIRWKDIFESLEQATDACETVAHILEGIVLKRGRRR